MVKESKLDNPVWNSLNEAHVDFSIVYEGIRFYKPAYCPFGGCNNIGIATKGINEYSNLLDSFFVIGKQPLLDNKTMLKRKLVCHQMLLKTKNNTKVTEVIVSLEDNNQKQDLFNLITLVQPGYFKRKTAELGRYFGIYKDGKLIAASGERMKMNEFTEISAIVTHPKHRGNGYAKQLIKHTTDIVIEDNKTPYLHVVESNVGAIRLYEKLGFITRRKMNFWEIGSV